MNGTLRSGFQAAADLLLLCCPPSQRRDTGGNFDAFDRTRSSAILCVGPLKPIFPANNVRSSKYAFIIRYGNEEKMITDDQQQQRFRWPSLYQKLTMELLRSADARTDRLRLCSRTSSSCCGRKLPCCVPVEIVAQQVKANRSMAKIGNGAPKDLPLDAMCGARAA